MNKQSQKSKEVGLVTSVRDYMVTLSGLPNVSINEIIQNKSTGAHAWISKLDENIAEAFLFDQNTPAYPGDLFFRTNQPLSVPASDSLLGRVISPLGLPLDGKSAIRANFMPLEKSPPIAAQRRLISNQLVTGFAVVDSLLPLGKGQRELILGDPRSGKSEFLAEIFANQKETGVICIWAAIGQPIVRIKSVVENLKNLGALKHTIVVATSSSEPVPVIFLTPHAAFSIAEYFQEQGRDVLVVLDDMGTHAKTYRAISLLARRKPGREAYPGDTFWQHARLLERAGNFANGSITALPVIEVDLSEFTTFIPTNLMATTDGHLLFRADLSNQGQRPAIDISRSVTRVGRQTQTQLQNLLSDRIKSILARSRELSTLSHLASTLPQETQTAIAQSQAIEEILRQEGTYLPEEGQTALFGLVLTNLGKEKDVKFWANIKKTLPETAKKDKKWQKLTKDILKFKNIEELVKVLERTRI
ncbi:MAG: F0F1 ATP synthase subunit alpha [Candidatus Blackburnbacteria bacterium]|nr:F0F1 ATP synthase subunit alpha [Candidatus Blackburnbacteria bacterium]